MDSLYQTIFIDHDLRLVALAIGICALGSLTAIVIAQHALKLETRALRLGWLLLASLVTGLSIWTTHVTAMLGYRQEIGIRFDIFTTVTSLLLTMLLATLGWLIGFAGKLRPTFSGVIIGVGVVIAHYADMQAPRFPGHLHHDPMIMAVAVLLGITLFGISGYLFGRWSDKIFAWPSALAMFAGGLSFHFIAMSAVTIMPGTEAGQAVGATVNAGQLAAVVVGVFLVLLTCAVAVTWQSESLSRVTAEKNRLLIAAMDDLRRTQAHHRAYVELNPQIAWMADANGSITELAPLWEQLVGIPCEEGVGEGWARVVHPDDLPRVIELWRHAVSAVDGSLADVRYRIRLIDGAYRWFRARARPRLDESGNAVAWYGTLEDIHDQVLAETALRHGEERYRIASVASNDVIWDFSFETQHAIWRGAHRKVLGYLELEDATPLDWWRNRIHPDDLERVLSSQDIALKTGEDFWSEEYRFLKPSGEWMVAKMQCAIVRNEDGEPRRLVGSMLDVTEQKRAQDELNWVAYHDHLTKLPNRALYGMRIKAAIDAAQVSGKYVALHLVDLNNFKHLNDTMGHAAGDGVLEEAAKRLLAAMPSDTTVARLGGDEFAIIVPGLSAPDGYCEVAAALHQSFLDPFVVGNLSIPVSYSAGVAIWPRDGSDPGEMLIAADLALYAAKAEMPGTTTEFRPSMKDASEKRSGMLVTARAGLDDDRIVPFYQPKIDLQSGQIMGWEALLRVEQDGKFLSPAAVEAAFADAELSVRLTDRMLARTFADLAQWNGAGLDPGRIAVNVSAADFRAPDLTQRLQHHAAAHAQCLEQLDIEVTETVLIGQLGPEVRRMLEELRSFGVMVALDDFGTGYASLTHLQQFPVDVIKIDKSFIDRIDESAPQATAVIDAVLQMARRLGMQSVAEGVETVSQARYLRARGCTIGQGYLFSPPVTADQVTKILRGKSYAHWEFGIA